MLEDSYFQNFKRDFFSGVPVCDTVPRSLLSSSLIANSPVSRSEYRSTPVTPRNISKISSSGVFSERLVAIGGLATAKIVRADLEMESHENLMKGKIVLITGATSGMGKETAVGPAWCRPLGSSGQHKLSSTRIYVSIS